MYVKIFDRILKSSMWENNSDTKIVWFTMLLLAGPDGNLVGTRKSIAKDAGVSLEATNFALDLFMAPDPESTTEDDDGRRIEYYGGNTWHVINYEKYRGIATADDQRQYDKRYSKARREAQKVKESEKKGQSRKQSETVGNSRLSEAYAEAEANTEAKAHKELVTVTPDGDKSKKQKPVYDKRINLNVETWELEGITDADKVKWAALAPACKPDEVLQSFVEYAQTNPQWLNKRLQTGAWSAAISTWFRNQARYGGNNGTAIQRHGQSSERVAKAIPLGCDKYGNEYSAVTLAREWGITQKEFDDVG